MSPKFWVAKIAPHVVLPITPPALSAFCPDTFPVFNALWTTAIEELPTIPPTYEFWAWAVTSPVLYTA